MGQILSSYNVASKQQVTLYLKRLKKATVNFFCLRILSHIVLLLQVPKSFLKMGFWFLSSFSMKAYL